MEIEELQRAVALFPKMTLVSVGVGAGAWLDRKCRLRRSQSTSILDETAVELLSAWANLQELELRIGEQFCPESLQNCQNLSHLLRSLTVSFNRADINQCLDHIRTLTSLTHLEIGCGVDYELPVIRPLVELLQIQHLAVDFYLINESGVLMFPSLTNLTRLEFDDLGDCIEKFNGEPLKAILPFASSLKRLDFEVRISRTELAPRIRGLSQLKYFTKLETLNWSCMHDDDEIALLRDALKWIPTLTCLSGVCLEDFPDPLIEALCSMSRLRSLKLTLGTMWMGRNVSPLSVLTQLTRLDIWECRDFHFIHCLAQLVELSCRSLELDLQEVNLTTGLFRLTRLESLRLSGCFDLQLPTYLTLLTDIKSLKLHGCPVDMSCVVSIASMEQLTELELHDTSGLMKGVCLAYVNCLANLERLSLYPAESKDFVKYLGSGKLKRLKHLRILNKHLSEQNKLELYQKLPSLRSIKQP